MTEDQHKFQLKLVGPFGLFTHENIRVEVSSKKATALIALLALSPLGLRTRNWLQLMLWGTRDTIQAQSSLRRELATIAKILGAHSGGHLLIRESQRIQLCLDHIDIDILGLAMTASHEQGKSGHLQSGEFLEGLDLKDCEDFEDWLVIQRQRIVDLQAIHIPKPVKPLPTAQEIIGAALPSASDLLDELAPAVPPKPSVTVLPFAELGSGLDRDEQWFGDAIAEEIGMTLAQFPQLFVVSSAAAAVLAKRSLTSEEIAKQLGVRYLLSGSIRHVGPSQRIAVHLLDGKTGQQIWGTSFNGKQHDLLELQETVATLAAPQVWTHIDLSERNRVMLPSGNEAKNYQLYWRANALFRSWNKDDILEAIRLTDELVALDPKCPLSSSLAAFCNGIACASGWTDDPQASQRAAVGHFQNAMRDGSNNVEALGYAAGTLVSIAGDMQLADQIIDHGLSLLPVYQPTLFWGGWVDIAMGNPARAIERFSLAMRINPASGVRNYALTGIGIAHLMQGSPTEAYPLLRKASIELSNYPMTLAALAVAAMLVDEKLVAKQAATTFKATGAEQTVFAILQNPKHRAMLQRGLKTALS
jgi:TolB-like protein